jgi:hypothetical protein
VLTQEDGQKEFVVVYTSRRLLDAEIKYAHIEKLCLTLYYACSKFRHYILSSSCIVTSQYDVIKRIMQKPILSGRLRKWAYSLVEYDLSYESLKEVKGQVVANFVIDHNVEMDDDCVIAVCPWKLFFDGSSCANGCGVGCVMISSSGVMHELSVRLEFVCTNNQAEYEALLAGLEWLVDMKVKHVEAYGDSQLVVQ